MFRKKRRTSRGGNEPNLYFARPSGHPTDRGQMKQLCIGQALECCGTHNGIAEDTALPATGRTALAVSPALSLGLYSSAPVPSGSSPCAFSIFGQKAHARQCARGLKSKRPTNYSGTTSIGSLSARRPKNRGCRSHCSGIHSRNSAAGTRRGASQPDTLWGTSKASLSRLLAVRLRSC